MARVARMARFWPQPAVVSALTESSVANGPRRSRKSDGWFYAAGRADCHNAQLADLTCCGVWPGVTRSAAPV